MNVVVPTSPTPYQRWQRFSRAVVRGFHVYANWLVGISWKRFIVLSLALLIGTAILADLPPFTWRFSEHIEPIGARRTPPPSRPQKANKRAESKAESKAEKPIHYEVTIDERGIRIHPRKPASAAGAASDADSGLPAIDIKLPGGANPDEVRRAIEEARSAIQEAVEDANRAVSEAAEAAAEAANAAREATIEAQRRPHTRTTVIRFGDFLVNFAFLWILSSAVIKIMYKGRMQAEFKAAQAAETAEAESLKRQVVEARMAAMQAQVEPHFLFNTLASIDHLIETDPPRASQMQKNLIALLRASMPTMREANASGVRDLGRELAVIKPYLEILKVRMEERLITEIDVPDGLLSAEFPPMMIQSLVENAIKHGLEPKAEGGSLRVKAEIVHGNLAVTVADTGLGFGRAATAGTGVGLANIRERLMLLYGHKASVTVSENQPCGTLVTIAVPYVSRGSQGAQS
jgi:signal transduction histidine kinase